VSKQVHLTLVSSPFYAQDICCEGPNPLTVPIRDSFSLDCIVHSDAKSAFGRRNDWLSYLLCNDFSVIVKLLS